MPESTDAKTRFGDYLLSRAVVRDKESAIYQASHRDFPDQPCLLKIFQPRAVHLLSTAQRDAVCQAYRKDFIAHPALRHPFIIRPIDVFTARDTLCLAFPQEFGRYRSLKALLQDAKSISMGRAARLIMDVLTLLKTPHQLQIMHGEIRPEHILLADDDTIRLVNFGMPLFRQHGVKLEPSPDNEFYALPHDEAKTTLNVHTDIYALGAILYQLLTTRKPDIANEEDTDVNLIPPSEVNSQIPALLDEVVQRAMSESPSTSYSSAEAFIQAIRDGLKFGKYVLEEILAEGGMGTVYQGYEPKLQRHVAIKTIRRDYLAGVDSDTRAQLLEGFEQEMALNGQLNHPNIITVYDADEVNHVPFVVMELISGDDTGVTLADYLKQYGKLPLEHINQIILQVLNALEYAHEHDVVHCDVKPENILISEEGSVKLADFGIARFKTHLAASRENTTHTTGLGTLSYMAPEQAEGMVDADTQTDLFAVGVIFYELLTGIHPFRDKSPAATKSRILSEDPRPPSRVNITLPKQYDALIATALDKDPDKRFQTAGAFISTLNKVSRPNASERLFKLWHNSVKSLQSLGHNSASLGRRYIINPISEFSRHLLTYAGAHQTAMRYSLAGVSIVLGLALMSLLVYLYWADQPKITVTTEQQSYIAGEQLTLTIQALDNISLQDLAFHIEGASISNYWDIAGQAEAQHTLTLDTLKWDAGVYPYTVTARDESGNTSQFQGQLTIAAATAAGSQTDPRNISPPTIENVVLADSVSIDMETPLTVELHKPKRLKSIQLEIPQLGFVQQQRQALKNVQTYVFNFSLSGVELGTYTYLLSLVDIGNRGSLYLGQLLVTDKQPPKVELTMTQRDQDTIEYQIVAQDNHALEAMIFTIENQADVRQVWQFQGEKYTKQSGEISVARWLSGDYVGVVEVADVAGNEARAETTLTLNPPDTTTKAQGNAIASVDLRRSGGSKVAVVETHVKALLQECQSHLREKRYTSSQANSNRQTQTALECYQQVLNMDDDNPDAIEGFAIMTSFYRQNIKRALSRDECNAANRSLAGLRKLGPLESDDRKLASKVEVCGRPPAQLNCNCTALAKKIEDWSLGVTPSLEFNAQERICQQTICQRR
ncbi:MAG: serine/threonine-protein kinase [Pseudomonadota bacterium]